LLDQFTERMLSGRAFHVDGPECELDV